MGLPSRRVWKAVIDDLDKCEVQVYAASKPHMNASLNLSEIANAYMMKVFIASIS